MNINQIIDWILKNPIAYPGKHNHTQPRTIETYMPLKPKDQFLLIMASLKEYIKDSYLNGKSLNIPKFGAFTFQILGPTARPIQHQKKLKVEKLPASYKVIRPCFVVDPYLRQHINQDFKNELDKSDSLYTFYQQGQRVIFCNSQILANISYVDKLTADSIINVFVQAITDLTKLGYDLDMDFGLCKISLKSKTLTYKFTQQLIDVVNEAEYCQNFLKQSNTSNCCAPYQHENKQMNEKFFAPWSPQSLISKIDTRIYKSIELPNKLLCLLISDKDTEKSAAALNVDVGSLCDPQERQGLAHFCEHMLFMGTEKYPLESEYQDFISKNSGQTNAFTSELNTNYIFQIANNSFYGALDRFAQFFISPLFSQSCTEREMKAVDSEYNMNLQNDFWRKFQLQHNASLPGSTYNKFMIGNLETLNFPDTRDYLLEFHKKYYSSNVMRLVVYGSQDIEQLENWTQELFSQIPNKDLNPPTFKDMPFNETNLGKIIKYVPIKDQDYLEVSWFIDYLYPHYKNCPGKYISHLLGHEGQNSLLSLLIKQNLASELTCGSSESMKLFTILNVRIKLTKKGLANHDQVLKLIFEYVQMLKQKGTQQWVFEETKAIKDLEFSFKEKSKPFDFVSTLASRLQLYPPELVLKAPYLMENFQPDLIQRIINQLTTKNILVFLSTKDFKDKLGNQEHYFKTEYLLQDLPENIKTLQIDNISPQLDLPPKNIFIPNTTELLNNPNQLPEFPEKIYETEQSTVYFKQDNIFKVPKAVIQLRIFCKDQGFGTLEDTEVLGKLWKEFIKNHMRELNYQAETAQIESSIEMANNGIEISISGFNDSVDRFIISMFERLKSFKLEDYSDQFDTIYTKTVQELENFRKQPPYQQVHSYTQILLREGGSFDNENLLIAIKNVKYDDLLRFANLWLKRARFEWLISGNLIQEDAIRIANTIENLYQVQTLPKDQILQVRTLNLPHEEVYNFSYQLKELTETNSAIVVYYQQEVSTIRSQVINDILANMIKSPFFQQLRTKEQLGYAVFSMISDIRGVQGLSFLIQSNSKSPNYVQQRIKLFLHEQMYNKIKELTEEQFLEYKESVRVELIEKDYSLNKESGRFWLELQKHSGLFNRRQLKLQILPAITIEEVKQFYQYNIIERPRSIEIHAISPTHVEEQKQIGSTTLVSHSIDWIKRRVPLYPDYYSML